MGCTREAFTISIGDDPGVLSGARAVMREMLTGVGIPAVAIESACTVASELVTNALMHGSPPVALDVCADGDVIEVVVRDSSASVPHVRDVREVTPGEGGYGLRIVAAMSDAWGTRPDGDGKAVWSRLSVRAQERRGHPPELRGPG